MSIYEQLPGEVARFDSLLEALQMLEDRRPQLESAKKLIRVAESIVATAPADADGHQMLGLAWYHYPGSSAWRSWHCRAALERALELEEDHQYALRYLAHLTFDQERYDESLALMERVELERYERPRHEWLALKMAELKLVCVLRRNPARFPQSQFEEFAAWYTDARTREERDLDEGSTEWPHELHQCGEWLYERGASPSENPLRAILEFMQANHIDIEHWNRELQSLR